MNILKKITIAVVVLLMGTTLACNKNAENKADDGIDPEKIISLEDIKDATFADSLAYYMGESVAMDYWSRSDQDASLAGEENAKAYKQGFVDGVKAMQEDIVYAQAYATAWMANEDFKSIKASDGISFNIKKVEEGFTAGMKSKDAINAEEVNKTAQNLSRTMENAKANNTTSTLSSGYVDSLSYYAGLSAAASYWTLSQQDTTISGPKNAEKFKNGFNTGLKDAQEKQTYVVGYCAAVMMCGQINVINQQTDVKLSPNRMMQGFNYAMQGKEYVDPIKLRSALSELESQLNTMIANSVQAQQGAPTVAGATSAGASTTAPAAPQVNPAQALNAAADKEGANQKTKSGIRYKVATAGSGANAQKGDIVTVAIAFKDLNGNIIQTTKSDDGGSEYVSFRLTEQDIPLPGLMEAILTMKPGGRSIFFVPASLDSQMAGQDIVYDVKLSKISKQ